METKIQKKESWEANTTIDLGEGKERHAPHKTGRRILNISTRKNLRGFLSTRASVCLEIDNGGWKSQQHCISFAGDPDGDYSADVMNHPDIKRCTEKSITDAHNAASELFQSHVDAAKAFYKIRGDNGNA